MHCGNSTLLNPATVLCDPLCITTHFLFSVIMDCFSCTVLLRALLFLLRCFCSLSCLLFSTSISCFVSIFFLISSKRDHQFFHLYLRETPLQDMICCCKFASCMIRVCYVTPLHAIELRCLALGFRMAAIPRLHIGSI